jgi:hypothetical protein
MLGRLCGPNSDQRPDLRTTIKDAITGGHDCSQSSRFVRRLWFRFHELPPLQSLLRSSCADFRRIDAFWETFPQDAHVIQTMGGTHGPSLPPLTAIAKRLRASLENKPKTCMLPLTVKALTKVPPWLLTRSFVEASEGQSVLNGEDFCGLVAFCFQHCLRCRYS